MEKARFEEIIELLIKSYRNQGEDALFAERDRINQQLAPDFLRKQYRIETNNYKT